MLHFMLSRMAGVPHKFQFVRHMIFDIKIKDFLRKLRLMACRHMTYVPSTLTYCHIV